MGWRGTACHPVCQMPKPVHSSAFLFFFQNRTQLKALLTITTDEKITVRGNGGLMSPGHLFLPVVPGLLLFSEPQGGARLWPSPRRCAEAGGSMQSGVPQCGGSCLVGFLDDPFIWARWLGHCLDGLVTAWTPTHLCLFGCWSPPCRVHLGPAGGQVLFSQSFPGP